MPVILLREMEEFWLDGAIDDPGTLANVLAPYPTEELKAYEVSSLVNSAANDGPEVIVRVA